jgi:hypothetical protein
LEFSEQQKRYSKKLYCSSKNSIEFTTLELGCLACSGQLPLGVLFWSHAKQALKNVCYDLEPLFQNMGKRELMKNKISTRFST